MTYSQTLRTRKGKNRKGIIISLLITICGILGIFFWRACSSLPPAPPPPPPPIDGFVSLVPPVDDSLPIGRTYMKGGLSGTPTKNFSVFNSWDTLHRQGIVGDTVSANSKIKNILNATFGGSKSGFEVVDVGGIKYYQSNDYSLLDLPDSGTVVVAAAVAARQFSITTSSGSNINAALETIKEYLPNAQFSSNGNVTVVASGTGLIVGVKLLKIVKHEFDTTSFNINGSSYQYIDPFTRQYNYISFTSAHMEPAIEWPNIILQFSTSHIKQEGTSKIGALIFHPTDRQIVVEGLGRKAMLTVQNPTYPNLSMPIRLLGAQQGNKIYLYQIVENHCVYNYINRTPVGSSVVDWNKVNLEYIAGSFRISSERWEFEIVDNP